MKNFEPVALWALRLVLRHAEGKFETSPGGRLDRWHRQTALMRLRLTLYFMFGGLGGGCIVAAYFLSLAGGISRGDLILPNLTGGAVLALGLGWVWAPMGLRLRHLGLVTSPTPSWTSYETYVALAFFLTLATLAKVQSPAIEGMVALTALAVMICQAQVARSSKSRSAWRAPEIPSLIVIVGLANGVGLIALLCAIVPPIIRGATLAPIVGMTLAAMGALRWRDYSRNAEAALRSEIAQTSQIIYIVTYAVPFALYLMALLPWPGAGLALPVAGVAAIAGGAIWTHTLVARLGHPRDFTASPIGL